MGRLADRLMHTPMFLLATPSNLSASLEDAQVTLMQPGVAAVVDPEQLKA